jgi:hypothetical protein
VIRFVESLWDRRKETVPRCHGGHIFIHLPLGGETGGHRKHLAKHLPKHLVMWPAADEPSGMVGPWGKARSNISGIGF